MQHFPALQYYQKACLLGPRLHLPGPTLTVPDLTSSQLTFLNSSSLAYLNLTCYFDFSCRLLTCPLNIYIYIHTYTYIHVCVYIHVCIYIYTNNIARCVRGCSCLAVELLRHADDGVNVFWPAVYQNLHIADEKRANQLHWITFQNFVDVLISIDKLYSAEGFYKLGGNVLQNGGTIPGNLAIHWLNDEGLVAHKRATDCQLKKSRLAGDSELGCTIPAFEHSTQKVQVLSNCSLGP